MALPTAYTPQIINATNWDNSYYIVDLGVLMDDTEYLMDDTVATMNDQMVNPLYAAPTAWEKQI